MEFFTGLGETHLVQFAGVIWTFFIGYNSCSLTLLPFSLMFWFQINLKSQSKTAKFRLSLC